jgi:hypothetical protein
VGVHANPRRAEESWAPRRPVNDCEDSMVERHFARAGASYIVAGVPEGPLGANRRRGLFHHRGLDRAA